METRWRANYSAIDSHSETEQIWRRRGAARADTDISVFKPSVADAGLLPPAQLFIRIMKLIRRRERPR
jgi:hypothetical protein